MKKKYFTPELEVVKIATQQMLASSGVETGGTPGEEYSSGDESYAREFDW